MLGKKILIIDDDLVTRELVAINLQAQDTEVYTAANGKDGLRQFYSVHPDLVILDVMMPEVDGFEVCRQVRQLSDVPVIMLTALSANEQIVRALDYGADDFVTKPFNIEVLLARVRAVLRRSERTEKTVALQGYHDSWLVVEPMTRQVLVQGQAINLTPHEFDLLLYLIQHAGRVCTFKQILENIWGWEYQDSPDYVHVYISHLRTKIEPDPKKPRYLLTVRGVGYRFVRN